MKKRIYTLILPAFLACLGWATAAHAGVCFVVGGDCGEFNKIMELKDCSDLGYNYTADNCPLPAKKLDGGQCKDKDDNVRYEKCICNPDYYQYDKTASDAYKYTYGDCCGDFCHTRACKADYKYPAGMTSGIAQDGDTCTDGGGTKSKDYKCTISGYGKIGDSDGGFEVITSGGTAQGYTANCYKPKTCAYYNPNYKENGNSPSDNTGYVTVVTYPDIKVGKYGSTIYTTTQSKTCYILRTASCGDYGLISGCNSGYEGQNATQKKSGSQNITCYTACIKKCDEGFTTSCSSTYCVQSGECYRPATCDDIDHVALSGGSYTGNATISSSSTTQNGYTTPSSTYNGSVTYYPKSGLTISGINPSMTESGNVTLKINNQTCYWSRKLLCPSGYYNSIAECEAGPGINRPANSTYTNGSGNCKSETVSSMTCYRPKTCAELGNEEGETYLDPTIAAIKNSSLPSNETQGSYVHTGYYHYVVYRGYPVCIKKHGNLDCANNAPNAAYRGCLTYPCDGKNGQAFFFQYGNISSVWPFSESPQGVTIKQSCSGGSFGYYTHVVSLNNDTGIGLIKQGTGQIKNNGFGDYWASSSTGATTVSNLIQDGRYICDRWAVSHPQNQSMCYSYSSSNHYFPTKELLEKIAENISDINNILARVGGTPFSTSSCYWGVGTNSGSSYDVYVLYYTDGSWKVEKNTNSNKQCYYRPVEYWINGRVSPRVGKMTFDQYASQNGIR